VSGSLLDLCDWFSLLCSRGPAFGYFPQPTKSFVVVSERFRGEAEAIFSGLDVQVVTSHRFLGALLAVCLQGMTMYCLSSQMS